MQKRYSKEFKETLIAFYHSGQSVHNNLIQEHQGVDSLV